MNYLLRDMPQDLHQALKICAILANTTLKELMLKLLAEHVRRAKEQGPPCPEDPKDQRTDEIPAAKAHPAQVEYKPYTQAIRFAVVAISHLEHIENDDPERGEALQEVINWCQDNFRRKMEMKRKGK